MILGQYSSKVKMECIVDPAVYVYALLGTSVFLYFTGDYMMNLMTHEASIKLASVEVELSLARERIVELESADTISDTEDKEQKQE